jgi:hypothetical protein
MHAGIGALFSIDSFGCGSMRHFNRYRMLAKD